MKRKHLNIFCTVTVIILVIIAISLSRFHLNSGGSWGYGRYVKPQVSWIFEDRLYGRGIEGHTFSYETDFPFIYIIGESGFTKVLEFPFITYIEKYPNMAFYNGQPKEKEDKISLGDDRLEELQEAYGYSLIIHKEYNDFSTRDRDIFNRMVQQYKRYAESDTTTQSRGMWVFLINTVNDNLRIR